MDIDESEDGKTTLTALVRSAESVSDGFKVQFMVQSRLKTDTTHVEMDLKQEDIGVDADLAYDCALRLATKCYNDGDDEQK